MNWYIIGIIGLIVLNILNMKANVKLVKKYNKCVSDLSDMQRFYIEECSKRKMTALRVWTYLKKIQLGNSYTYTAQQYLFDQWWESTGKKL